jgi:predicted chitinase
MVTRANVEATKEFIRARVGNPYVYGGALSMNVRQGTDCSEVWQTVLEMVHGRWQPGRQSEGATTESYRYVPVGGVGPFGTIRVASPNDIPPNAVAKLAFHHGPGGGANSHMWGELDGMRIESAGSKGLVTGDRAKAINDPYGHAWAYLPGPIVDDGAADPVDVLAMATGLSYARAQVIYPTIRDGLIQADCTNTNRIAMFLAQTGHESDNFQATAEYASGDAYDTRTDLGNTPQVDGDGRLYKGRTYIMITGKDNYRDFSRWAHGRGLVPTPTYFVDHPVELSELKWAGIGAAWYWVVERPDINALSDRRDLRTVTYRINGGYNGYEDRERRYNRALSLGDQLLTLIQGEDDFLSALNPGEQRLLFDKTLQVWGALFNQVRSKSGYRDPNGSLWAVKDYVHNMDGFIHEDYVEREAKRGNPAELARVVRSARGQGEDRSPEFIARAQRVLTEIERDTPEILDRFIEEGVGL